MSRRHRLNLRKFVEATNHELMERYFKEKLYSGKLPPQIIMKIDAVEKFLDDPRNIEFRGLVLQDFRMINDICGQGKSTIVWIYRKNRIYWDRKMSPQSLAMKLFLDHKKDFDWCYAWFCYRHLSGSLSYHLMSGEINPSEKKLAAFLELIRERSTPHSKNREVIITLRDEEDSTIILIKHGSYVHTVAHWKDIEVKVSAFRRKKEDILFYDKKKNILSINASPKKDRKLYLLCFRRSIIGDESAPERDPRDKIFSLEPMQKGKFQWQGNENIKAVVLTEIGLNIPGARAAGININSEDVMKTIEEELPDISLDNGELVYARLRFLLEIDGKKSEVQFTIKPPSDIEFSPTDHLDIINEFLEKQRIKLV